MKTVRIFLFFTHGDYQIKKPHTDARRSLGENVKLFGKPSVQWLLSTDTLARRLERLVVVGVVVELFPKSGVQGTNSGRLISEFRCISKQIWPQQLQVHQARFWNSF